MNLSEILLKLWEKIEWFLERFDWSAIAELVGWVSAIVYEIIELK